MDRKLLHMDVRNVYVSFVKRASATDSYPLSAAYIRRQWYSHDQIQVLYEQLNHRTGASWWRVRPVISRFIINDNSLNLSKWFNFPDFITTLYVHVCVCYKSYVGDR